MNIPAEILEATRLTRAGRLADAMASIKRALHGSLAQKPTKHAKADTIEGVRVVDIEPESAAASPQSNAAGKPGTRRASRPAREGEAPFRRRFIAGSFANQAGARAYKLYVPSVYSGQALPLIVMLHGCSQDPEDFAAGTRMNSIAEESGCFVLYPAQAQAANISRCWNWFQTGDQLRGEGEPAIIAGMTQDVVAAYHIDAGRVYVAGLSAGGAMAAIMARTYPDLYAAAGIHSGLAYAAAHDMPSALAAMRGTIATVDADQSKLPHVPTVVFHGDEDTTVHPANAEAALHHRASDPRVQEQKGQVPGGRAYTRAVFHDGAGAVLLEQWTIHGSGHAWSGGSPRGSFTDPKGPDASQEMMRFFMAHRNRVAANDGAAG